MLDERAQPLREGVAGAPVRATIWSKRRTPRNTSRTASSAHFSPTTSRVRATEQVRGWVAVLVTGGA